MPIGGVPRKKSPRNFRNIGTCYWTLGGLYFILDVETFIPDVDGHTQSGVLRDNWLDFGMPWWDPGSGMDQEGLYKES